MSGGGSSSSSSSAAGGGAFLRTVETAVIFAASSLGGRFASESIMAPREPMDFSGTALRLSRGCAFDDLSQVQRCSLSFSLPFSNAEEVLALTRL